MNSLKTIITKKMEKLYDLVLNSLAAILISRSSTLSYLPPSSSLLRPGAHSRTRKIRFKCTLSRADPALHRYNTKTHAPRRAIPANSH